MEDWIARAACCIGAIEQIIQGVPQVIAIKTSFAEKQQQLDADQQEEIHTAGEQLQQED